MKYQVEGYVPDFGEDARKRRAKYPDELYFDDGGMVVEYQIDDGKPDGFYVLLRSWMELDKRIPYNEHDKLRAAHPDFAQFAGKRVRITVETIDG